MSELPPLPKPTLTFGYAAENSLFTADQMRAYALAAVEADRAARASVAEADAFEYAWTEPHNQLPAYVNLKRDGGVFKLTVRQRGAQYGQAIELPNYVVDGLALYFCRPELVSDEDAEKARVAIDRAVQAAKQGAGQDARDAARYRWLREQQWDSASLFVIDGGKERVRLGTDCPSLFRLDAAIDAAIAAAPKEGAR